VSEQKDVKFADYPLIDSLRKDIAAAGFETPTPIQARCIPLALAGKDVIGLAQTGTGKTAAFALPIIQRLAHRRELGALVLAPTRELAQQIASVFAALGRSSGIRAAVVVGGVPIKRDYKALRTRPNVLVATPGRLIDHLKSRTVVLDRIETFVVDEADRMHDMGFMPQVRRVIEALPRTRQTLMFAATLPADVELVARRSMKNPERVQVGRVAPVARAEQKLFAVDPHQKTRLLLRLLERSRGRVLVFARTRRGVERLATTVAGGRHSVARLHSDRSQPQREQAMAGFRDGRYRILIATDIAARGLDVADIEHVINYDFPGTPEDYLHRIGRTARYKATGRATSFVTRDERSNLAGVERLVGSKLTLAHASL
jgi:ATP-dependent RNA helicase RhlE